LNFLVDTNVISELTKPLPNPAVVRWLAESDEDRVFLSVISLAEIRRGIALLDPGRRRDQLEAWFRIEVPQRFEHRLIGVDREIAERWGDVIAASQRRGIALSAMDAFLAATAQTHKLTLVTRNLRDFVSLDLVLLNPWGE
jgi:predicted nucleic acid-binding protein